MQAIYKNFMFFNGMLGLSICFILACTGPSVKSTPIAAGNTQIEGAAYALPKGVIKVNVSRAAGKITFTAAAMYLPDRSNRFSLEFLPSSTYYDIYDVIIDANGLLSSSTVTTTDETSKIVTEIGNIKDALTSGAKLAPPLSGVDEPPKDFSIVQVIDPFDRNSVSIFNGALRTASHSELSLAVSADPSFSGSLPTESSDAITLDCASAFCFRLPMSVFIGVYQTKNVDSLIFSESVIMPDPTLLMGIPLNRAPCISKRTELKFSNGMLTTSKLDKPSEALACLAIPAKILQSLLGLPQKKPK